MIAVWAFETKHTQKSTVIDKVISHYVNPIFHDEKKIWLKCFLIYRFLRKLDSDRNINLHWRHVRVSIVITQLTNVQWVCVCVGVCMNWTYVNMLWSLNIKMAKWTPSESLIISNKGKLVNLHSNCTFESHDSKYRTPAPPTQIRFSIFSIEPAIDMAAPFVAWPQSESHATKLLNYAWKSFIFIIGYWIVSFRHLFIPRRRTLPAWLLTSTILITGRMVVCRWLMSTYANAY